MRNRQKRGKRDGYNRKGKKNWMKTGRKLKMKT